MAAHGAPKQVVVLGGGDGMAVREVLKYPGVESVTLVELDPHMTQLFSEHETLAAPERRLAALAEGARSSTPTRSSGWSRHGEMFDVIVVDFPDPTNFSIGKLYTSSFYALLEQHLAASGYAVVQTTSPLVARKSFWTVAATIEAVGLTATPYHAHVPSFGEWGFIIAEPAAVPAARGRCRRACASCRLAGLPRAVRLSARHGARAGRGQPAVEPGAGARPTSTNGARSHGHVTRGGAQLSWAPRPRARGRCAGCGKRRAGIDGGLHRRRRASAATRCATRSAAPAAAPAVARPHARRHRRRRHRRPGGGARAAARAASTTSPCSSSKTTPAATAAAAGRRACLPARRALPAGAGRRRARGAGPARGARPAPPRGRPLGLRRAPPVPQPAGAPVLPRRAGTKACCRVQGVGAGDARAVPALRAARRARCSREARFAIPTLRTRRRARPCWRSTR